METYRRGAFTEKERAALKLATVLSALSAYREDRSPFNRHRLSTALSNAGLSDKRVRDDFIDRLMKSRKFGDG